METTTIETKEQIVKMSEIRIDSGYEKEKQSFFAPTLCFSKHFINKNSLFIVCTLYWLLSIAFSAVGWFFIFDLLNGYVISLYNKLNNFLFIDFLLVAIFALITTFPFYLILLFLFYFIRQSRLSTNRKLGILAVNQLLCSLLASIGLCMIFRYNVSIFELYKHIIITCTVIFGMNILAFITIKKSVILSLTHIKNKNNEINNN